MLSLRSRPGLAVACATASLVLCLLISTTKLQSHSELLEVYELGSPMPMSYRGAELLWIPDSTSTRRSGSQASLQVSHNSATQAEPGTFSSLAQSLRGRRRRRRHRRRNNRGAASRRNNAPARRNDAPRKSSGGGRSERKDNSAGRSGGSGGKPRSSTRRSQGRSKPSRKRSGTRRKGYVINRRTRSRNARRNNSTKSAQRRSSKRKSSRRKSSRRSRSRGSKRKSSSSSSRRRNSRSSRRSSSGSSGRKSSRRSSSSSRRSRRRSSRRSSSKGSRRRSSRRSSSSRRRGSGRGSRSGRREEATTKWNGDHVLNGGNKEWSEEDAAMHAFNMQNWRGRILDTQLDRQRKLWRLMHPSTYGWNTQGWRNAPGLNHDQQHRLRHFVDSLRYKADSGSAQLRDDGGDGGRNHVLAQRELAADIANDNAVRIKEIMQKFGIDDSENDGGNNADAASDEDRDGDAQKSDEDVNAETSGEDAHAEASGEDANAETSGEEASAEKSGEDAQQASDDEKQEEQ